MSKDTGPIMLGVGARKGFITVLKDKWVLSSLRKMGDK